MNPDIQIIRYQDCESSLWKNGGGSTKQLLIWPKGADLSNFDFRISIATISSNGPFSLFNGIDRKLCILGGAGVRLNIKGNDIEQSEEIVLRPNDPPFCFSGETIIESMLLDKEVLDFNVMTKRKSYNSYLERKDLNGKTTLSTFRTKIKTNQVQIQKKYLFIIFLSDRKIEINKKPIHLNKFDAILLQNPLDKDKIIDNDAISVTINKTKNQTLFRIPPTIYRNNK
ncbi:HutD family protein [Shewanella xiamenensis]|uniref:HutD/Ves family protein n=1 Tax=Shewanella xiamenensis TaxID=332186 RepID=UPI002E7B066C|nr:HutD family protein [Shewanella xiamenensis]